MGRHCSWGFPITKKKRSLSYTLLLDYCIWPHHFHFTSLPPICNNLKTFIYDRYKTATNEFTWNVNRNLIRKWSKVKTGFGFLNNLERWVTASVTSPKAGSPIHRGRKCSSIPSTWSSTTWPTSSWPSAALLSPSDSWRPCPRETW